VRHYFWPKRKERILLNKKKFIIGQNERKETTQDTIVSKSAVCATCIRCRHDSDSDDSDEFITAKSTVVDTTVIKRFEPVRNDSFAGKASLAFRL
jgi:hypothetical protein